LTFRPARCERGCPTDHVTRSPAPPGLGYRLLQHLGARLPDLLEGGIEAVSPEDCRRQGACSLNGTGRAPPPSRSPSLGPFEGFVGLVALTNVIVAGVAHHRRKRAIRWLEQLEQSGTDADLFSP